MSDKQEKIINSIDIPVELRNPLQISMMEKMGIQHNIDIITAAHTEEEKAEISKKIDKKNDWALTHGREISLIIDDPENKEIRNLIFEKKFEEAAPLIFEKMKIEKAGE